MKAHKNQILNDLPFAKIKKPDISADFKGTELGWDNLWQALLKLALTTSMRKFYQNIPSNTPPAILKMVEELISHLHPARINKIMFEKPGYPEPTIGETHDFILNHFAQMLVDKDDSTFKPAKISELFYSMPIGSFYDNRVKNYSGLAKDQYSAMIAVGDDFENFTKFASSLRNTGSFSYDHGNTFSELKTNVLTSALAIVRGSGESQANEQLADDFYAINSHLHYSHSRNDFDEFYLSYCIGTRSLLEEKIKILKKEQDADIASTSAATYLNTKLPDQEDKEYFISSLPIDELRRMSANSQFVNLNTLNPILKRLTIEEIQVPIINLLKSTHELNVVLNRLPKERWPELMQGRILSWIVILTESTASLALTTYNLSEENKHAYYSLLGCQIIRAVITDQADFEWAIHSLPEHVANEVILLIKEEGIKNIFPTAQELVRVLGALPDGRKLLIKVLGESIKDYIENARDISDIYKSIPDNMKSALINILGDAYLKLHIKSTDSLLRIIEMLPVEKQLPFMKNLGADVINNIFKTPVDLAIFLDRLPDGLNTIPAHELIATLGKVTLKGFTQGSHDLYFLSERIKPEYLSAMITLLGDQFVSTVDMSHEKESLLRDNNRIKRGYEFYTKYQHQYDEEFSDKDILGSIERLFTEPEKEGMPAQGLYMPSSADITASIVYHCKNTKPGDYHSLLAALNNSLMDIDRNLDETYRFTRITLRPNGEVANRIMYSMMKLNQALHPAPVVGQKEVNNTNMAMTM